MRLLRNFRRKLARLIFVEDVPQNVVHLRDYSPSADRNARMYDEAMKWHRAEAERINGKRNLRCLS